MMTYFILGYFVCVAASSFFIFIFFLCFISFKTNEIVKRKLYHLCCFYFFFSVPSFCVLFIIKAQTSQHSFNQPIHPASQPASHPSLFSLYIYTRSEYQVLLLDVYVVSINVIQHMIAAVEIFVIETSSSFVIIIAIAVIVVFFFKSYSRSISL